MSSIFNFFFQSKTFDNKQTSKTLSFSGEEGVHKNGTTNTSLVNFPKHSCVDVVWEEALKFLSLLLLCVVFWFVIYLFIYLFIVGL